MAKTGDRFEVIYEQGVMTNTKILLDKQTGVQYLYHQSGYGGGLAPLLGRDGKPAIAPVNRSYDND